MPFRRINECLPGVGIRLVTSSAPARRRLQGCAHSEARRGSRSGGWLPLGQGWRSWPACEEPRSRTAGGLPGRSSRPPLAPHPRTLFSPHAQYATRFSLRFVVSRPGRPLDDVCISRELLPPFPGRTRLETAAHTKAPSSFHSPGDGIICYSPTYLLDRSQLHESSVEQSARPRPLEMPGRRGRSRLSKQ